MKPVASHLETAGVPAIYRIHDRPDPKRVMEFEDVAATFGYSLGAGATPVKQFRETTLASSDKSESHFAKLSEAGRENRGEAGGADPQLPDGCRSFKEQARYSDQNAGHFALAASSYTHFTSPIRRYPDLMVHRALTANLDGRVYEAPMHAIADSSSETERRAAEAERELVEWKKVKFMIDRVGEEFAALIISTTRFGFFVELEDLFIEGLVPMETLGAGEVPNYHEKYAEDYRRTEPSHVFDLETR